MKKISFLVVISFIPFSFANAQFAKNNAIYANGEMNFGNYWGGNFGLNYVYQEKYALQLGLTGNMRKAKSIPEDYTVGAIGIFALLGANTPLDQWVNYSVSFGRVFKLNPSGTIRMVPSIGIGYKIYTKPENWMKIQEGSSTWTENYSYEYIDYNAISLIINPKIEFPVIRYWGLTVSPMVQISRNGTYVGIGFGKMIGLLRDER